MSSQKTLQLTSPLLTNPVDILPVIFTPHPPFPTSITLSPSMEISQHLISLNHIGTFHLLPVNGRNKHYKFGALAPLLEHMHENNVSYRVEFPGQQLIVSAGKTTLLASFDDFSQNTNPGVDFACTLAFRGHRNMACFPVWIRLESNVTVDLTEWPELIILGAEELISLRSLKGKTWVEPILRIANKSRDDQKKWSNMMEVMQERSIAFRAEIGGRSLCLWATQNDRRDGLELTGAVTQGRG